MPSNMLGKNMEELLRFWKGPLADLMVKLMGEGGDTFEQDLNAFLRKESEEVIFRRWSSLKLRDIPIEVRGYLDRAGVSPVRPSICSNVRSLEHMTRLTSLDLSRVRLVPPYTPCTSLEHHTQMNAKERFWYPLGIFSFITCWGHRNQLPLHWQVAGRIYFDGFTVIDDGDRDYEFSLAYLGDKWTFEVGDRKSNLRTPTDSCSAVYI